jgi:hypothetical protein
LTRIRWRFECVSYSLSSLDFQSMSDLPIPVLIRQTNAKCMRCRWRNVSECYDYECYECQSSGYEEVLQCVNTPIHLMDMILTYQPIFGPNLQPGLMPVYFPSWRIVYQVTLMRVWRRVPPTPMPPPPIE